MEVLGRRFQFLACDVCAVEVGPLKVLGAEGDRLEIAVSFQRLDVAGRVLGQFGHGHFRDQPTGDRALGRVVVDEHQGVRADIELVGDLPEVACLVIPVGNEAGDVGQAEDHLGVFLEDLARDGVGVLGAHGQDDAALSQGLHVPLERQIGLALRLTLSKADAAQSVVAAPPT